jgi:hypothetical protein
LEAIMRNLVAAPSLALLLAAAPQAALAQSAPFCLKRASGAISCTYHTMILCEQGKQPHSRDQCIPRFQADETTGSSGAPLGGPRQPGTTPVIDAIPAR